MEGIASQPRVEIGDRRTRLWVADRIEGSAHDFTPHIRPQHGLSERVDRNVTCKELLEHGAEQESTASLERKLVDLELDFEYRVRRPAALETADACTEGRARTAANAIDLASQSGICGWCIKLKHLAQRVRPLFFAVVQQREIVERRDG